MTPEEIIEDFQSFSDWEDRFCYLLDLADELPDMDEADKTDENRLFGCQSRVWLKSELLPTDPPVLHFTGDSDAQLVRDWWPSSSTSAMVVPLNRYWISTLPAFLKLSS